MISITCTHCKSVLTIDDAFAGGVCRCQHCGTIQTVPAHLKGNMQPPQSAPAQKTLFQAKGAGASSGGNLATAAQQQPASGLDELAQVVASSGLSGSGLSGHRLSASGPGATGAPPLGQAGAAVPPPAARKKKSLMIPLAVGGGLLLVALIGAVIFLALRGNGGAAASGDSGSTGGSPAGSATASFAGVPIAGDRVVYVVDRANSMRDMLDPVKSAIYESINSLGPDKKFAVVMCNNGGDDLFFPAHEFRSGTSDQISQLKGAIGDLVATGSSTLGGALQIAIARQPTTIVVITAKSHLENDDESTVNSALDGAGGKIRIYAFTVGSSGENNFLKAAVKGTGGQYKLLSERDLRAGT